MATHVSTAQGFAESARRALIELVCPSMAAAAIGVRPASSLDSM
jgi:hypothetical protein